MTTDSREILDLLGIEYAEAGRRLTFICPLPDHADSRPSTCAYPDEGRFKCFGCDASGDMVDLYAGARGLTRAQAEVEVARLTGKPVPRRHEPDPKVERRVRRVGEAALAGLRSRAEMPEFFAAGERLDKLCWAWRRGMIGKADVEGGLRKFLREVQSWPTP